MNPIDLIALLFLVLGVVLGARSGFLGPVLGLIGAAAAFGLALVLASVFGPQLAELQQPTRALVTLLGLGTLVLIGEAVGATAGASLSFGLRGTPLRAADAVGGAVVGVAHVVLLLWLFGGMLAAGMAPNLVPTARGSVALGLVGERLPSPVVVSGRLLALLDTTQIPGLLRGIEPPPAAPVELPSNAEAAALARSAMASTARITSSGCGTLQSVGSGFFVSPTHVVTNAHVVAGSSETTITQGSTVYEARVVAFDPDADLALVYAPEAHGTPLRMASDPPSRGTTGAVLGYPGGGNLTVTSAAVSATFDIEGPDIYGDGRSPHSIVELRAAIHHGNSGGPLITAPGTVGGVVFGSSRSDPDVGYAIGPDQVTRTLAPSIDRTRAVDTGSCL